MASIFSRIIAGEIPCYKVAENDEFLAFLDIMPLAKGHTLVIPKRETDYLFDIDNEAYQRLWLFAKEVAVLLKQRVPCKRIGVSVIGLEVPHAHIHLVPLQAVQDMNFSKEKSAADPNELAALARLLFEGN
ncbi:MAG: HIT family protein [Sphingomonadales bacterium]